MGTEQPATSETEGETEHVKQLTVRSHCILTICNFSYMYLPVLVLRAGFRF